MQSARALRRPETAVNTLRVLAVSSIFPNEVQPNRGIFNAQGIEQLAKLAGIRVVSPVKWFPGLGWASAAERKFNAVPPSGEYHGIPVTYPRFFRTPGFGRRWHSWMYAKSVNAHVTSIIDEYRPHVLFAIWAHPDGVAMQQLGEELGIPVVIKCMGSDVHQLLNEKVRGRQALDALARCARVITVSHGLKKALVDHGIDSGHIDVVYNGVDRQIFHHIPRSEARRALNLPAHGKMLLCVANLLPIKRHCDLLAAFRVLRREIDASLVLIGEGHLRKALEAQARELRIAHDVRFVGACRHDRIPLWTAACDAVCLASANEGLPNVLYEALACGRPVVATAVGGIPELVSSPDYGRLVKAGDVNAMAGALIEVLGRAWDPQTLSACPRVITWQQCAEGLFNVLKNAKSMTSL